MASMESPWQLRLIKKSLKKREKLSLLDRHFSPENNSYNLDLGCAQGILSYFLRRKGGWWLSADLDTINLVTSRELLKNNLLQLGPGILPFHSQTMNNVISLDYLEHLDDDRLCLKEIFRVLKPGGTLILAVPRTGRGFFLHRIRPFLGMKLEFYGHKREGYSWKTLSSMLEREGFVSLQKKRFSGFLTESIELILNVFYTRFYTPRIPVGQRDGHIRPTTQAEFVEKKGAFKLYSLFYPLVWLFSRLDKLFFFQRGYGLIVWAKKPNVFEDKELDAKP
jgi:SAM-dependent methyltransferase